jgi:hypothetical protein
MPSGTPTASWAITTSCWCATAEGNLERILRHLNGLYTQYFNRSEKTDGPLFRGRYRAILVDAKAHGLALSRLPPSPSTASPPLPAPCRLPPLELSRLHRSG